ncbi:unnamed protein product [Cyprideis torosa]|uniref:Protein hunchback n=1 Tax=Cyprideis torosa TaxID=163714 RepID=A0A7R8WA81_9CRUS|nr:unnamed protein product [Cyprideis torosa]CAG0888095.1 unnamed protein product [Cyprideis torosa]
MTDDDYETKNTAGQQLKLREKPSLAKVAKSQGQTGALCDTQGVQGRRQNSAAVGGPRRPCKASIPSVQKTRVEISNGMGKANSLGLDSRMHSRNRSPCTGFISRCSNLRMMSLMTSDAPQMSPAPNNAGPRQPPFHGFPLFAPNQFQMDFERAAHDSGSPQLPNYKGMLSVLPTAPGAHPFDLERVFKMENFALNFQRASALKDEGRMRDFHPRRGSSGSPPTPPRSPGERRYGQPPRPSSVPVNGSPKKTPTSSSHDAVLNHRPESSPPSSSCDGPDSSTAPTYAPHSDVSSSSGTRLTSSGGQPFTDPSADCQICGIECKDKDSLYMHLTSEHGGQGLTPSSLAPSSPASPRSTADRSPAEKEPDSAMDCGEENEEFMQEIRTPKVSSSGKVKVFKCKQCGYVAITKSDFWEHSRIHIKPDKLLQCPKCPFVSEYKHHLEYHLRNHFNSKPFRCSRCNYTCVNKSMLNSHMKSHSAVYQYRCGDCSYATKYCHSLKLHLRKYGHKPDVVLNPDGTPNPLPIIDVYGTRRGPKIKKVWSEGDENGMPIFPSATTSSATPTTPTTSSSSPDTPVKMESSTPYITSPKRSEKTPSSANPLEFSPVDDLKPIKPSQPPRGTLRCNLCPFVSADREQFSWHLMDHAREERLREEGIVQPSREPSVEPTRATSPTNTHKNAVVALDLTKSSLVPEEGSAKPTGPKRDRRKGRAVKLDQIAWKLREDEEHNGSSEYRCEWCDISFKEVLMYTLHMGYHGYSDPFTCNMCGQKNDDKRDDM